MDPEQIKRQGKVTHMAVVPDHSSPTAALPFLPPQVRIPPPFPPQPSLVFTEQQVRVIVNHFRSQRDDAFAEMDRYRIEVARLRAAIEAHRDLVLGHAFPGEPMPPWNEELWEALDEEKDR